ncbi:MAG: hypothetical protein QOJ12_788, partial [Thermoleophilales bacterium]|nr:hypothetical protein [Thermoleophilales bacterium]
ALAAGELANAWGAVNPSVVGWRSTAALASLQLGDRDEAARLAAENLELAEAYGAPRALGIALRVDGVVTGGERGIESLERAVDLLSASGADLEHARALAELGAALRRARRRAEAREPLRAALDLATRCGATPLAERAHAELAATGARPRRVVLSGADALTAREREVAQMAAAGGGNVQIAQALFVTRGTVEKHLEAVFRKLGIHSRDEIAAALIGDG